MLNAMREGAKSGFTKFILFGFMVMAVGGLVFMDIGGFFRGGITKTGVAKIGGQELSIVTFDEILRRVLARQGLDPQTAYQLGFVNQVLTNEISNNVLQHAATDLGLKVDDKLVIKQLNRILEPLVTKDMDKKSALAAILRNQGMSERDFVRMLKAEMSNTLLRSAMIMGPNIFSKNAAQDLYQYKNEERTLKIVFLPHSNIKDVKKPTDEILLPFYQAGQERYAIPETRTFSIAILSSEQLEKTLDISNEELKEVYERDIASYKKPETRILEQAVLESEATAAAIANTVKSGTSLKEAVKKETESEDPYLGEESFEREGLPAELAQQVFSASANAIVGPVKTPLGWHILKVKKIISPTTESFEKVKDSLKKELLHMRVADEMFATANHIDDSFAGGATLEEVAEDMGLNVSQYGPLNRDGSTTDKKDGTKDFGEDWPYVLETVFELMEKEVSPVFELSDGSYAVVRIDTINEKSYKPFASIKEDLAKLWIQDQKEVTNKLLTQDKLKALNNGEKTLNEIAAESSASVKTLKLKRSDEAKPPLDDRAMKLFFALPKNSYGVSAVKDGYVIAAIDQISLPEIKNAKTENINTIAETGQREEQEEIIQMYLDRLYKDYHVKINAHLLETTYGPGSEVN